LVKILRIISFGLFLAFWFGLANLHSVPYPQTVIAVAWSELKDGRMLPAILITLRRISLSFSISFALGFTLGCAAGRSNRFDALVDPWIIILLNLPMIIITILFYVWLGLTDTALVLAVVVTKTPAFYALFREGIRTFDSELDDVAEVFRLTMLQRLRVCLLPQLLPYITTAVRTGLSLTWKIVLVGELLGRSNGVGYQLNLHFQNFNLAGILAYGICFSFVMLTMEYLILQPFERIMYAYR
jgi:NitT/TauT family transport system permease protein